MLIREVQVRDAEDFLRLSLQLDEESQFMLFEPGERTLTVEEQAEKLEEICNDSKSTILVAEDHERLIGFTGMFGSDLKRIQHRASIVMGIIKDFQSQGLGKELLSAAESWATENNISRLELTVMGHNRAAMILYDKMGYRIEGMRKSAIILSGAAVDEFYMGKLLTQKEG